MEPKKSKSKSEETSKTPSKIRCQIPEFWCGDKEFPKRNEKDLVYYSRNGSRHECLKRGIGVGRYMNEKPPTSSIRNIRYVGEKLEERFIQMGIRTLKDLYNETKVQDFDNTLRWCCTQSDGKINKKAYNSVIWHLLEMGYPIDETKCYEL